MGHHQGMSVSPSSSASPTSSGSAKGGTVRPNAPGTKVRRRNAASGIFAAATMLLAVLVLIQAVYAGRYTAGLGDILTHGHVGNASFVVGLAVALLALVARVVRRQLLLAALVLLMLFTQTGMGYMGRTMPEAAAWHVPLGVMTFALVVLQAVWAAPLLRGGSGSSS